MRLVDQFDGGRMEEAIESHVDGFEQFLGQQRSALLGFLRLRTASAEDAQDAVQESMLRLLRYRESQQPENWRALMYKIASNVALEQSRRARVRQVGAHVPLEDHALGLASGHQSQEELAIRQQELEQIAALVATLPLRTQEIFVLSRVEGMRNEQIARHCAISLKAVEKHMTRALKVMRQRMAPLPGVGP